MEFNRNFFERGQDIVQILPPTDVNAGVTGDWIRMTYYDRCSVLLKKDGSEQVDTLGMKFLQAQDASGTGSKDLACAQFTWNKFGTMTSQTVWVAGTAITTPTNYISFGSAAPTGATAVIADCGTTVFQILTEVLASALDVANGFDWFTVNFDGAQVDNSCLLEVLAILQGGRFPQAIPLSAIS